MQVVSHLIERDQDLIPTIINFSELGFHRVLAPYFNELDGLKKMAKYRMENGWLSQDRIQNDNDRIVEIINSNTIDGDLLKSFAFRYIINAFISNLADEAASSEIIVEQRRLEAGFETPIRKVGCKTFALFVADKYNTIGGDMDLFLNERSHSVFFNKNISIGELFILDDRKLFHRMSEISKQSNELNSAYVDALILSQY